MHRLLKRIKFKTGFSKKKTVIKCFTDDESENNDQYKIVKITKKKYWFIKKKKLVIYKNGNVIYDDTVV